MRVSSRPRIFFWRPRLTLAYRGRLAVLGLLPLPLFLAGLLPLLEGSCALLGRLLPLPLGGLLLTPRRLLVQHPLEDLIGPIQLCHRQDHIDQPSPAISVTDGGVQQFLTLGQLVELPVLLRGHRELAQIPCLSQHPPQIDLAVDFFMISGQRQGQGQHIFQGRAGQPDGHLTAGKHHAYQLVGGLTASDVHLVPPPFSVHLHLGSFFPSVVSDP